MITTEILKHKGGAVFTVPPGTPVALACKELVQRRVGALVVSEGDRVAGVFSERDVVRAVATDGPGALNEPVSRYMTAEVVIAVPTDTVEVLMERMTERRIRHLPVIREGALIGVVSIGDVVKHQIAKATQEAESLRTYISAG